jgi:acyl-[acyl-carrier-protein]-phospholipid O-acyltransferase/long-chain-fatty-acid--[acyl-carrier-protein] ligase
MKTPAQKALPMLAALMRQRRFAPLFWCQFLSALNDNFVRNMLAMLILFRLGEAQAGPLITLAVGIFILPSIFLSGLGGEMADAHDKARIARGLKGAEIFVQMLAAAGLWLASLPLLYAALFGLGIIAALFGPIKYGILPDHLETRELTAGNALIEAATFLAILLGLIAGGLSAAHGRAPEGIVLQLMVIAFACFLTSLFIPATGAAAPGLCVNFNLFASTRDLVRGLRIDPRLWNGALAVSWFWVNAAVAVSLVPVIIRHKIGGGIDVETAITTLLAFGIGFGSIMAAMIARGRIFLRPVPYAALGMAFFLIDLGLATAQVPTATAEVTLGEFLRMGLGIRIAADVAGVAAAGGLFVVPIFAAVQAASAKDKHARVIGGVNILNALMMVAGTLAVAVLQSRLIGLSEPVLLALFGFLNIGAAVAVHRSITRYFLASV